LWWCVACVVSSLAETYYLSGLCCRRIAAVSIGKETEQSDSPRFVSMVRLGLLMCSRTERCERDGLTRRGLCCRGVNGRIRVLADMVCVAFGTDWFSGNRPFMVGSCPRTAFFNARCHNDNFVSMSLTDLATCVALHFSLVSLRFVYTVLRPYRHSHVNVPNP
jgi:hypothetical protein